jgi:hypothetical protein
LVWFDQWCLTPLSTVSFIGGGNQSTRRNHRPVASQWQTLSHNVVSSIPRQEPGFELTALVVIGTDWTDSCKSNYNTITTTPTCFVCFCTILKISLVNQNVKIFCQSPSDCFTIFQVVSPMFWNEHPCIWNLFPVCVTFRGVKCHRNKTGFCDRIKIDYLERERDKFWPLEKLILFKYKTIVYLLCNIEWSMLFCGY